MTKDARETSSMIDLMFEACENIRDHGGCAECPITSLCLNDPEVCFMDIFEYSHAAMWDEFYNYADNVTFSKEDLDAQNADFLRKYEVEERMIDDEYNG